MIMAFQETHSARIKVVFIGNNAVGKTSIAKRYLGHGFDVRYKSTIGADFYIKKDSYLFPGMGRYQIEWMIWDLAGQEYFNVVRSIYYNKAKAAIIVFDVSRPSTFRALPKWIREFWQYTKGIHPFIIVGNKIDLREEKPCLPPSYGKKYAETLTRQLGFPIPYVETSAKTGHNIKEAFEILAQTIIRFALAKARKSK